MNAQYTFLVEITGLPPSPSVTEQKLYFATRGFTTGAADSPASTSYRGWLTQPIDRTRSCFFEGSTYGKSSLTLGDIEVQNPRNSTNTENELDGLIQWDFDGRLIEIYAWKDGTAFSTRQLIHKGTIEHPTFNPDTVAFTARDRQAEFDGPFCQDRFLGNNVLPNGYEGTADDIKGSVKPFVLGTCFNVRPPCCNTSLYIYYLTFGTLDTVLDVRVRGQTITRSSPDYSSAADCIANSPPVNTWRFYNGIGGEGAMIRFGSQPDGEVTCDPVQTVNPLLYRGSYAAQQIADRAGRNKGNPSLFAVNATDITALNAQTGAELGRYIDDEVTTSQLMDELCETLGCFWDFDAVTGEIRLKRLDLPVTAGQIIDIRDVEPTLERIATTDMGQGKAAWRQILLWGKNSTVQNSDLVPTLSAADRAKYGTEYREAKFEDVNVKVRQKLAIERRSTTWFTQQADADTEAERRFVIQSVRRHMFKVVTAIDDAVLSEDLGDEVGLLYDRWNLAAFGDEIGTPMRILSETINGANRTVERLLWGADLNRSNRITTTAAYRVTTDSNYRITR